MAAERIQPALSSIGLNRGGAQVLSPVDPRQEVRPNQLVEDYKKREEEIKAAQKAREANRSKILNSAYDTQYDLPANEAKKNQLVDKFIKDTTEGKPINQAERELKQGLTMLTAYDGQKKEDVKRAANKTGKYKDAYLFLEGEGYTEDVTDIHDPFMSTDVPEDETVEEYIARMNSETDTVEKENVIYSPQYSEEDITADIIKTVDAIRKNKGKESIERVYDANGEVMVIETLKGVDDNDFNEAIAAVKNNPAYASSFMTGRMIQGGDAPWALKDEGAKNQYINEYSSFVEEFANSIRPEGTATKTLKKDKPSGRGAGDEDVQMATDFKNAYALAQNTGDLTKATKELNRFVKDVDSKVEVTQDDEGKRILKVFKGATGKGEDTTPKLVKTISLDNVEEGYRAFTDVGMITEEALKESTVTKEFEFEEAPILKARSLTEEVVKAYEDDKEEDVKAKLEQVYGTGRVTVDAEALTFDKGTKDEIVVPIPQDDDPEEVKAQKYKFIEDMLTRDVGGTEDIRKETEDKNDPLGLGL